MYMTFICTILTLEFVSVW